MENEKKRIRLPIIVEGRYDKSTVSSIFDATVITTDGFGIFNSKEKVALIKKLAERGGIILLTDSDGGGKQIRSYLSGILPKDKLFHVFIPQIKGKEGRKKTASKAGFLGVEGMDRKVLEEVLSPFVDTGACDEKEKNSSAKMLTKLDFFNDGLSGTDMASVRRGRLAEHFGFPPDISANALIEVLNLAVGYDKYREAFKILFEEKE